MHSFTLPYVNSKQPADHAAQRLFIKIDERLHYMEDVALFKALNNQPIEDPKREAVVLAKAQSDPTPFSSSRS